MRNGQNKRMRGRNNNNNNNSNRKGQNPLTRVYESNGPDLKIRGTASHIADKYVQLARDAHSSSDPVAAENYYQHAEHYFRLIAAAQEQFRQANPYYRPENEPQRDDQGGEDGEDDGTDTTAVAVSGDQPYGTGEQPFIPREAQPFPQRDQQHYTPREPRSYGGRPQQQPAPRNEDNGDGERLLPSFITGGQPPQPQPQPFQGNGENRLDSGPNGAGERFPLHRRRRRHRGPRSDQPGGSPGGDEAPPSQTPSE